MKCYSPGYYRMDSSVKDQAERSLNGNTKTDTWGFKTTYAAY